MLVRPILLCLLLTVPAASRAQRGAGESTSRTAPSEAAQFAFLVGQWELAVHPSMPSLVAKLVRAWVADATHVLTNVATQMQGINACASRT